LHQKDSRVSYLSLARNFGHQIAVTAGLHYARGQAVIILDADLQDPPEVIPDLIQKWKQGYQVVYAQRTVRHKEALYKRVAAYTFTGCSNGSPISPFLRIPGIFASSIARWWMS
jgi:dolichol-phosphate mannosyltransferase